MGQFKASTADMSLGGDYITICRYATSQLGQLSLASLRGRLIEYQFRLGVRAGMSPLPGGRYHCVMPYGTCVPVAVRLAANCYTPFTFTFIFIFTCTVQST